MHLRTLLPVTALSLLLVAALEPPVLADDATNLASLARRSGETGDVLGFLKGLRTLGDVDLRRADINRALTIAGVPSSSPIATMLAPFTRLRIDGNQVGIQVRRVTAMEFPGGALRLDKDVSFRLRGDGDRTRIDRIRGIDVGESSDKLYDLKKVDFRTQSGRPVARVTAGVLFITETVTIPLPMPASSDGSQPEVVARSTDPVPLPRPKPEPRRGISSFLGNDR